jgi:hypothetical protein
VSDAPHVTAAGLLTRAARARARAARPSTPRAVAADRLTRAAWWRVSRGTFRTAGSYGGGDATLGRAGRYAAARCNVLVAARWRAAAAPLPGGPAPGYGAPPRYALPPLPDHNGYVNVR